MMRKTFLMLSCFAVFAVAAVAQAQSAAPQGGAPGVVYKKQTRYDFDDDVVEGQLQRPDGEYVGGTRRTKHSSLIKIRENFIPEMLKSAEDI